MAVIVDNGHVLRIGVEQFLTRLRAQKKIPIIHKSLHVHPLDFANMLDACDPRAKKAVARLCAR